ncbi:hypothetical protein [Rhizobium leguminosarum]|uniref:hypothetical protein n=1 Tax=Rhizobium leguminosarum TaxID=384 RepID=UPI0004AE3E7A|nr:hypothetical protein [Rhizobium leguminosarum]UIK01284.1 hypothetical protein LZK82_24780 [Rhizobium leguminosarum]UIK14200.1 hypothetical protein LZK80_30415 [Rhizobium leguminosarum]UIL30329.1 hypothetical protein LZK75_25100 [Rhizobium leguminosarum]
MLIVGAGASTVAIESSREGLTRRAIDHWSSEMTTGRPKSGVLMTMIDLEVAFAKGGAR